MKCPNCGEIIADDSKFCVFCGKKITNGNKGKKLWPLWLCLAVALTVGGSFYYYKIYIPNKWDAEAPRYYTIAPNVNLRSSCSSGGDYNKVKTLPYGTALITYHVGSDWLTVKTEKTIGDDEQVEGYVSAKYTLNKPDYFLLNSIWGDMESQEVIRETRWRKALLSYFKSHDYIGNISENERLAAGINTMPNVDNQWQVFSKPKGSMYNTTYFSNLIDEYSKYQDFAVIIKNTNTGKRKLLYYYFQGEDESPVFYGEYDISGTGYIKKITKTSYDGLKIELTGDPLQSSERTYVSKK